MFHLGSFVGKRVKDRLYLHVSSLVARDNDVMGRILRAMQFVGVKPCDEFNVVGVRGHGVRGQGSCRGQGQVLYCDK